MRTHIEEEADAGLAVLELADVEHHGEELVGAAIRGDHSSCSFADSTPPMQCKVACNLMCNFCIKLQCIMSNQSHGTAKPDYLGIGLTTRIRHRRTISRPNPGSVSGTLSICPLTPF